MRGLVVPIPVQVPAIRVRGQSVPMPVQPARVRAELTKVRKQNHLR